MKSTFDLYGLDPKELAAMPYRAALEKKIAGAKELLREAILDTEVTFSNGGRDRETLSALIARQNELVKAITHNEALIDELDYIN